MRIFTYHLAPMADALYGRLENDDLRHRGWRFALYRALRSSVEGYDEPVYWKTAYRQWSIDHHYRGSRHSAKSRIADCHIESIERLDADTIQVYAAFIDVDGQKQLTSIGLQRGHFHESMWISQNIHGDTLLEGPFERDRIFDGLMPNNMMAADDTVPPGEPIDLHPKLTALHAMTEALRGYYAQASAAEKSYLETVVGAAVFYLPQTVAHFSGYISLECLKGSLEDERRVKDHIYPRKRAGRHLLTTGYSPEELHVFYHGNLARFMYLTASENSKMVNYYETYEEHDSALEALGIVKFPSGDREPFHSHAELNDFLRYLQREGIKTLKDQQSAERLLDAYRQVS